MEQYYFRRLKSFGITLFLFFCALTRLSAQTFPAFTAIVSDTSSTGYYFILPTQANIGSPAPNPTQMIVDGKGNIAYFKVFNRDIASFARQKNGLISYSKIPNIFYFLDSTFNIVDSVTCKNGVTMDTHEMQLLDNGHYLLLGIESVTMDLSSYPIFKNATAGSATATVRAGVIQELDENKNLVFEWHAKDHFSFTDVDSTRLTNPTNVDWTHCNAIDMDTDGNILLSSRHFNEITKINRATGAVMWRLGGKANQFAFMNDNDMFKSQHDIRRIANGNITLLDNGRSGSKVHPVAAKEYRLDEAALKATLVWDYTRDPLKFSQATGNVQRLKNGNTLVNYGFVAGLSTTFDVVKPNGNKVFELAFNDTLHSYRVFNYPGLPWDLHRPVISCTKFGNQYYLEATGGHKSYKWSNGDTSQKLLLTQMGTYSVIVPQGNGGFLVSEPMKVINISDPCNALSLIVNKDLNAAVSIYPNPVTNKIILKSALPNLQYELINSLGENIWSGIEIEQQDLSYLPTGLYFLKINSGEIKCVIKFVKE